MARSMNATLGTADWEPLDETESAARALFGVEGVVYARPKEEGGEDEGGRSLSKTLGIEGGGCVDVDVGVGARSLGFRLKRGVTGKIDS